MEEERRKLEDVYVRCRRIGSKGINVSLCSNLNLYKGDQMGNRAIFIVADRNDDPNGVERQLQQEFQSDMRKNRIDFRIFQSEEPERVEIQQEEEEATDKSVSNTQLYDLDTRQPRSFFFDDGRIYCVTFWITGCHFCIGGLQAVQKAVENNPQWKGRAEVFGLHKERAQVFGLQKDEGDAHQARNFIRDVGDLDQYSDGDSNIVHSLNVRGFPHTVFIMNGKVLSRGHPESINIEGYINTVLATGEAPCASLNVGDSCDCITVMDLQTKSAQKVQLDPNKTYFLNFWSTENRESRRNMQKLQLILYENSDQQDRVQGITLSFDKDPQEAFKTLNANEEWDMTQDYWSGGAGTIDDCMVIKEGKVVWKGNPAKESLKELIQLKISSKEAGGAVEEEGVAKEERAAKEESIKKLDFNFDDKIQQAQEMLESGITTEVYFHLELSIRENEENLQPIIQIRGNYNESQREDVMREGDRFKELFKSPFIDYNFANFY